LGYEPNELPTAPPRTSSFTESTGSDAVMKQSSNIPFAVPYFRIVIHTREFQVSNNFNHYTKYPDEQKVSSIAITRIVIL
jgi:hypothetical protein